MNMATSIDRLGQKILKLVSKHITHRDIHAARKRWSRLGGDQTLRLEYPLDQDSVVFDLGGFHGDFSHAIHERYGCMVYLFEPVQEYYDYCVARFKDMPQVRCFNFGLGAGNGKFTISNAEDGSSLYLDSSSHSDTLVEIRDFHEFIQSQALERIDLIKINIEGGEYDVIPRIIHCGFINNIRNLQIQFHDFMPDAHSKRDVIRHDLESTHEEDWCFKFVWESWRLKS